MKTIGLGVALGLTAGLFGVLVYELVGQFGGWLTTCVLLGVIIGVRGDLNWKRAWWGLLGGVVVLVTWLGRSFVSYPIVIAWPIVGALYGVLNPTTSRIGWRVAGFGVGFAGGFLGMGILPLLTLVVFPSIGLPTTFDYDIDALGMIISSALMGGGIFWVGSKGRTAGKKCAG